MGNERGNVSFNFLNEIRSVFDVRRTFWANGFRNTSTNSESFEVQELNPLHIGHRGENRSNFLCILGKP